MGMKKKKRLDNDLGKNVQENEEECDVIKENSKKRNTDVFEERQRKKSKSDEKIIIDSKNEEDNKEGSKEGEKEQDGIKTKKGKVSESFQERNKKHEKADQILII